MIDEPEGDNGRMVAQFLKNFWESHRISIRPLDFLSFLCELTSWLLFWQCLSTLEPRCYELIKEKEEIRFLPQYVLFFLFLLVDRIFEFIADQQIKEKKKEGRLWGRKPFISLRNERRESSDWTGHIMPSGHAVRAFSWWTDQQYAGSWRASVHLIHLY